MAHITTGDKSWDVEESAEKVVRALQAGQPFVAPVRGAVVRTVLVLSPTLTWAEVIDDDYPPRLADS